MFLKIFQLHFTAGSISRWFGSDGSLNLEK
jgi:hypothetical protein